MNDSAMRTRHRVVAQRLAKQLDRIALDQQRHPTTRPRLVETVGISLDRISHAPFRDLGRCPSEQAHGTRLPGLYLLAVLDAD